jgi:hypothetical protein
LPNGRQISPAGAWIKVAPFPYAVALRPGGGQLVAPAIGWPFSLNIFDIAKSSVLRIPAGLKNDPELQVPSATKAESIPVPNGASGAISRA